MPHHFHYLLRQIETDLLKATQLCNEIKQYRRLGPHHSQLDALQRELEDGQHFIRSEQLQLQDAESEDLDGEDDIVRVNLAGYVRQVEEINARLDSIARPHYSGSRYHHRRHSHHSFFYLSSSRSRSYHRDVEVPHFHELRTKWENIQDGISRTFAEYLNRIADKKRKKTKDNKKKEELDKLKKKIEAREREDRERLEHKEREEERRLQHLERARDDKLEHVEHMARRQDYMDQSIVGNILERDPIHDFERVAGVVGNIQRTARSISPRRGRDPIYDFGRMADVIGNIQRNARSHSPRRGRQVPLHLSVNASPVGYRYPSRERAVSARPVLYQHHYLDHDHWHLVSPNAHHRSHSSHSRRSSISHSPYHEHDHDREVVKNIVIESVGRSGESDRESIRIDGDHLAVGHHGREFGYINHLRNDRYPHRQHQYLPGPRREPRGDVYWNRPRGRPCFLEPMRGRRGNEGEWERFNHPVHHGRRRYTSPELVIIDDRWRRRRADEVEEELEEVVYSDIDEAGRGWR